MAHDPAPSTPNRPAYRPLEIGNNGGQYAYGSDGDDSGTPGSPAKRGGRTLWTKYDDDDGDDDASGSGESVVTQVTSATPAAAPAYGSGAQGRLRRGGSGRGAGGGGGGGGSFSFTSFLCCVRPDEDERYPHQWTASYLAPHHMIPAGSPIHAGDPFIGPIQPGDAHKPCLVLDLDETLVHSSFKPVPNPDYIIPVEIDKQVTDVYVLKRPWVDYFMEEMGKLYEVVVFTASLSKYADPLLDLLDKDKVIRWRLFRESCYPFQGNYVKDLTCLGREMEKVIIIDNSPHSYALQPQNALPISSFIDDPNDNDLLDSIPYLQELAQSPDVTEVLVRNNGFVPRCSFHSRGIPIPDRKFA